LIKCRALLDTCATANLISEALVKRIGIKVVTSSLEVGAINGMTTESKGMVGVTIQSIHDNFTKELTCLIIPVIANLIPSEVFPRNSVKMPANIRLADPEFHIPRAVDLLIGSGTTLSLFAVGQINLTREGHELFLQKTRLGWVVAGGTNAQEPKVFTCYLTNLEDLLTRFWAIEEVAANRLKSVEEIECEEYFDKTVTRDAQGRYVVRYLSVTQISAWVNRDPWHSDVC